MERANKEEIKSYFKSKRFIISISICALALAIGIGGAIRVNYLLKKQVENITRESTAEKETTERITEKAANDVTGIADERTTPTTENIEIVKNESFIFPVGKTIIKDYSNSKAVKSATMNDWRVHNAVDFACKDGDNVISMQSGAVLAVYDSSLWGVIVEIDHGNGIVARYCGLKKGTVPDASDAVEQGEIIGKIGNIPIETKDGTHLHLEVTKSGKAIDPLELLSKSPEDK